MLTSTYKKNLATKLAMLGLAATVACTLALAEPPTAQARELTADTPAIKLTTQAKKSIAKAKVSKVAAKTYTGKAIKPKPKVTLKGKKLKLNKDYKLTYKNNLHAGKATIKIKGIGKYTGTKSVKFTIDKVDLSRVKFSKVNTAWSRKAPKSNPAVLSKMTYKGQALTKGTDYKVDWKAGGPKGYEALGTLDGYSGTLWYTVKGTGDFTGSKVVKATVTTPKIKKTTARCFSNGGGIVYADNPTVLYVATYTGCKNGGYGIVGGTTLNCCITEGDTIVTVNVIDRDPSKCETITTPKGLAEAYWKYTWSGFTNPPAFDYLNVWGDFLFDAYKSPTSLKQRLNSFGLDCSDEFAEFLHKVDMLGGGAGNWCQNEVWILV